MDLAGYTNRREEQFGIYWTMMNECYRDASSREVSYGHVWLVSTVPSVINANIGTVTEDEGDYTITATQYVDRVLIGKAKGGVNVFPRPIPLSGSYDLSWYPIPNQNLAVGDTYVLDMTIAIGQMQ